MRSNFTCQVPTDSKPFFATEEAKDHLQITIFMKKVEIGMNDIVYLACFTEREHPWKLGMNDIVYKALQMEMETVTKGRQNVYHCWFGEKSVLF